MRPSALQFLRGFLPKLLQLAVTLLFFLIFPTSVQAATLYWVGSDGANASVASNWSTSNPTSCSGNVTPSGAAPASGDTLNFDADCDNGAVWDSSAAAAITVLTLNTNYAGTVTLARSLQTTGATTLSGGVLNASNQSFTVDGTFTMNTGSTFRASSGTTTFSAAFTINGGTFDTTTNTGGTVTFSGASTRTLACGGVSFNLVVLANTGARTINSDCSFPLGANPNLSGSTSTISLSGTLSGTGTLTKSASTLTMNSGASLSGFNGLSLATFTVAGATVDLSSYLSFATSSTLTLSSGSISLPSGADLNGNLTISGGTFNAPTSATMTVAGALTISGTPTFNANSGTITFDGSTVTLACNNVTFNLVSIPNTSGTKTINSDCSFPLGASPSFGAGGITLSGTLSGTGTLSKSGGNLTLNSGAVLSGFSALSIASLTLSGATLDLSNYSSYTATNTTTVSSGSLTLSNTANTLAALTVSGGTLTQSAGTWTASGITTVNGGTLSLADGATLNGSLLLSSGILNAPSPGILNAGSAFNHSGGTFNAGSGTVNFISGSTSSITCTSTVFNLVTFNNGSDAKTINSSCTIPVGNNSSHAGRITNKGIISGSGTLTNTYTGSSALIMDSTGVLSGFSGLVIHGATTVQNSGTLDLTNYTTAVIYAETASTALSIVSNSLFKAPTSTLQLYDTINNDGTGTFTHNNGTVLVSTNTLDTTVAIQGSFTFYNLTSAPTIASTVRFTAGSTTTVVGTLTLKGDSTNRLVLDSGTSGTAWNIDPQGSRDIQYVDVSDSTNINATVINVAGTGSVDSGRNIGWIFNNAPTVSSLGPSSMIGGGYISSTQPSFTFTSADSGDTVSYQIQIDDSSDFSSAIVDYTSALATPGATTFTVGQAAGSGTYNTGSAGQSLTAGSYYWRVRVTDSYGTASSYSTANSGSVAFILDAIAPTAPSLNSPGNLTFTTLTNPTFSFNQSTDAGSGVANYVIVIDSGTSNQFNLVGTIYATGSNENSSTRTINYSGTTITAQTNLSANYLSQGMHTWTVIVTDNAGNTNSSTSTIYIDYTSPTFSSNTGFNNSGTYQDSLLTDNVKPIFNGTFNDNLAVDKLTFTIYKRNFFLGIETSRTLFATEVYTLPVETNTTTYPFVYTISDNLDYGKYTIDVVGFDKAGNQSAQISQNLQILPYDQMLKLLKDQKDIVRDANQVSLVSLEKSALTRRKKEAAELNRFINEIKRGVEVLADKLSPGIRELAQKLTVPLVASLNQYLDQSQNETRMAINNQFSDSSKVLAGIGRDLSKQLEKSQNFVASLGQGLDQSNEQSRVAVNDHFKDSSKALTEATRDIDTKLEQSQQNFAQKLSSKREKTQSDLTTGFENVIEGTVESIKKPIGDTLAMADRFKVASLSFVNILSNTEPTTIANVTIEEIGADYTIVSWETNDYATSKVNYGTTLSYGEEVIDNKPTKFHQVKLTNLEPGKRYFFEVMSQGKNYAYDAYYSFETPAIAEP